MSTSTKRSLEAQQSIQSQIQDSSSTTRKRPRTSTTSTPQHQHDDTLSHTSPSKPSTRLQTRQHALHVPSALGIQSPSLKTQLTEPIYTQLSDLNKVQVPSDLQIPSPPSSSSDDATIQPNLQNIAQSSSYIRPPVMTDAYDPPLVSQDSACFSFSRIPPDDNLPSSSNQLDTNNLTSNSLDEDDNNQKKPYYTKAFDYVIKHVLKRYKHILETDDIDLAIMVNDQLSQNAQSLFVRLYRRKQPQWYRLSQLQQSYQNEIDVDSAVDELCQNQLLISSIYTINTLQSYTVLLAKELLTSLDVEEMRQIADCVAEGTSLRKLSKSKLLPALCTLLNGKNISKTARKLTQTTLSGVSPTERLAKAILHKVGHCIRIPQFVLTSLERIHFLFFLEDGHNSPNVILADTGKTKFPEYTCDTSKTVFSSLQALQAFENAICLEKQINEALESKDYTEAAHLGSLAEAEVKHFLSWNDNNNPSESLGRDEELSSDLSMQVIVRRNGDQEERNLRTQIMEQLQHPFFRRFTAQWVYVRITWHSVHALERLGEYALAVARLRLLLNTDLMAKRRGKCLNRLTINLYSHLHKLEEPLQVIVSELQLPSNHLNFGDRLALARRGSAIFKKLRKSTSKPKRRSTRSRTTASQHVNIESNLIEPEIITETLKHASTKIPMRKIFGKSLNVQMKERLESREEEKDPWQRFVNENSRDSYATAASQTFSLMGKSVFASFRSGGEKVSVEEYCLEWYYAKERWDGIHDEGASIRFLFSLFLWDSGLFMSVPDVFQTPYQDRPLDLFTEVFFSSRRKEIDSKLQCVEDMTAAELFEETERMYNLYNGTRAIGCLWNKYSSEVLATIAAGLGGKALARCFRLLAQDYSYWGGGLPDLTLWQVDSNTDTDVHKTKLVEVKSARDTLSERQKAWLIEFNLNDAACEVCKVVESETNNNATELQDAKLECVDIDALNARSDEREIK